MIVGADIHLGKINDSFDLKNGEKSQTHDIRTRLDELLKEAVKDDRTIMLLGDIFTRVNPSTYILTVFFEWLAKCRSKSVDVILFPGNHDSGFSWINSNMIEKANLPNVKVVLDANTIEVLGRQIFVIPHLPLELQESIEDMTVYLYDRWVNGGKADFIVGHGMIKNSDYGNDIFFEAGNAITIDTGLFDVPLIALGHIHKFTEIKQGKKSIVYPGSLTINNFGEVDERKTFLKVALGTLDYEVKDYTSEVTTWVDLNIDLTNKDESDIDEAIIKEMCSGAVVKVTVLTQGLQNVNESYLRKMINKYGKITRFETKVLGSAQQVENIVHANNPQKLLGVFINEQKDISDEVKALALKLGKTILTETGGTE